MKNHVYIGQSNTKQATGTKFFTASYIKTSEEEKKHIVILIYSQYEINIHYIIQQSFPELHHRITSYVLSSKINVNIVHKLISTRINSDYRYSSVKKRNGREKKWGGGGFLSK